MLGNNNTIYNNVIHDVDYSAGDASAVNTGLSGLSKDHEVIGNTMYNSGRGLFVHRKSSGIKFRYNELYNAGIQMTDLGATYTYKTDGGGTEIAYNWIHDTLSVGGYGAHGIYLDNESSNYNVHHNVIWNGVSDGIRLNTNSLNNKVYNNTIVGGSVSIDSWGPGTKKDMRGTEIINNIFRGNVRLNSNVGQEPLFSNNLTKDINPLFVNPAANQYNLQASSPAVNSGLSLAPCTNCFIGTAPDMGAYEYGAPLWKAGATSYETPPASPILYELVKPVGSNGSVSLRWGAVSKATGFKVHYGTTSGQYTQTIDVGNVTSYTVTGLADSTRYYFAVSPYNGTVTNGPSNEYSVLTQGVRSAFVTIPAGTYDAQFGVNGNETVIGGLDNNDGWSIDYSTSVRMVYKHLRSVWEFLPNMLVRR